jgi:GAF domain-containing protein
MVEDALRNTHRLLGESMNWVYGEAWVPADGSATLTCETTWTAETADLEEFREQSTQMTSASGEGLAGRVWEAGGYEWIQDVSTAPESVFRRTDVAEDAGLKAALGVPIRTDESLVGVMVFLMAEEQSVDERMVEVTRAVGANLGLLMAQKLAEDALQARRDLVTTILETTPIGIVVINAEIKELVCDRLANSDPYRFVWFGERDFATDSIAATASAGVEDGYLDEIELETDTSETGRGPIEVAFGTHESQVQNNVHTDPPFEPWRQEAMERGYRACLAVPVVYTETFYGLLNRYAGEPDQYSEIEQAVLTDSGR